MTASEFAGVRSVRVGLRRMKRSARAHSRRFAALLLTAVVLSAVFVAALTGFGSVAPARAASAGPLPTHAVAAAAGSNVSGPSIFNEIWNLFSGFFNIVLTGLGQAFSTIFGAFANGVAQMFQGWGFALGGYGVWGPMMVVVSLAVAAVVAYFMLDMIGMEKDLDEGEAEL